jgi:maleylacetoacetate isomerase
MLKLYSYFRSSASYRVRIALHWKRLEFTYLPVHLIKEGGQQNQEDYRIINPLGHVPALDHCGFLIAESVAIVDYLDRIFPERPLFPSVPQDRALVLQIMEIINSGVQPLQNLKVNRFLEQELKQDKSVVERWNRHWIERGLMSLERLLERTAGRFCLGEEVTAADAFLIPQCFSSRRFGVEIERFPLIARLEKEALKLDAFQKAHPEKQPDYTP